MGAIDTQLITVVGSWARRKRKFTIFELSDQVCQQWCLVRMDFGKLFVGGTRWTLTREIPARSYRRAEGAKWGRVGSSCAGADVSLLACEVDRAGEGKFGRMTRDAKIPGSFSRVPTANLVSLRASRVRRIRVL